MIVFLQHRQNLSEEAFLGSFTVIHTKMSKRLKATRVDNGDDVSRMDRNSHFNQESIAIRRQVCPRTFSYRHTRHFVRASYTKKGITHFQSSHTEVVKSCNAKPRFAFIVSLKDLDFSNSETSRNASFPLNTQRFLA